MLGAGEEERRREGRGGGGNTKDKDHTPKQQHHKAALVCRDQSPALHRAGQEVGTEGQNPEDFPEVGSYSQMDLNPELFSPSFYKRKLKPKSGTWTRHPSSQQ